MAEAKLVIQVEDDGPDAPEAPAREGATPFAPDVAERAADDEVFESKTADGGADDIQSSIPEDIDLFEPAPVKDVFEEVAQEQAEERAPGGVSPMDTERYDNIVDVHVVNFDELDLGPRAGAGAGKPEEKPGAGKEEEKKEDGLAEIPGSFQQLQARTVEMLGSKLKSALSPLAEKFGLKFQQSKQGSGGGGFGAAAAGAAAGRVFGGGTAGGVAAGAGRAGAAAGAVATTGLTAGLVAASVATAGLTLAAILAKKAFDAFSAAMQRQVEELRGFSADVAGAAAQTTVRRLEARVGRAGEIGPQVARFEDFRSRLEIAMYDIQTKIYGILLGMFEVVQPALELILAFLEKIPIGLGAISETAKGTVDSLTTLNFKSEEAMVHWKKMREHLFNLWNFFNQNVPQQFSGGPIMEEMLEAHRVDLAKMLGRPPLMGP